MLSIYLSIFGKLLTTITCVNTKVTSRTVQETGKCRAASFLVRLCKIFVVYDIRINLGHCPQGAVRVYLGEE